MINRKVTLTKHIERLERLARRNENLAQNNRKLNSLIKRIYNDPEIKRLTSRVLTDDGAWGTVQIVD